MLSPVSTQTRVVCHGAGGGGIKSAQMLSMKTQHLAIQHFLLLIDIISIGGREREEPFFDAVSSRRHAANQSWKWNSVTEKGEGEQWRSGGRRRRREDLVPPVYYTVVWCTVNSPYSIYSIL